MSFEKTSILVDYKGTLWPKVPFPLRFGVPFAQGFLQVGQDLGVQAYAHESDSAVAIDSAVAPMVLWPDGSIRWARIDCLLPTPVPKSFCFELGKNQLNGLPPRGFELLGVSCNSGRIVFAPPGNSDSMASVALMARVTVHGASEFQEVALVESQGESPDLNFLAVDFCFQGQISVPNLTLPLELVVSGTLWKTGHIDVSCRIRNPNASEHPGGNWDLGNRGCALIDDLTLRFESSSPLGTQQGVRDNRIVVREAPTEPLRSGQVSIDLFQSSSGGANWQSSVHVDRDRRIPMSFCGYSLVVDDFESRAHRASPYIAVELSGSTLGVASSTFWQNFPHSIRARHTSIEIGFFPKESDYPHELQGGEQKTFDLGVYFGPASADSFPLDGYLSEPVPRIDSEYLYSTGVIPEFIPATKEDAIERLYNRLVEQAIVGENCFISKREKIDGYGWRNFGDIYGDHEAVYHKGKTPLISHYNNQYDCTLGFCYQYLRTGNRLWYEQMIAMAQHSWDIDTYHTDRDKLLYNGGLFWHTYHYADADTGTHRSYPRSLLGENQFESGTDLKEMGATGKRLKKVYGKGGGPAASHNYSSGWMFAYYLTADRRYFDAAVNAADYVLQIEDGTKTPFRFLARTPTGFSTNSSEGYYGPGRASANSTLALLNGYDLTSQKKYLDAAVAIMKRTVHPEQNLERLDLLNAELRWFYTMYLQSLARLIDVLRSEVDYQDSFYYAVASLMHYARWMARNERPILSEPQKLQYPTETWATQDIRKWQVLAYAAQWATTDQERDLLLDRSEFFYEYSINALDSFSTKSLCRPVVLLLNFGWQRAFLGQIVRSGNPVPKGYRFIAQEEFVPQKVIAMGRAKKIIMVGTLVGTVIMLIGIVYFLRLWIG